MHQLCHTVFKNILFFSSCLFLLALSGQVSAATAYLTWEASPDANVAGYKIYFDTESHTAGKCPNDYANYANPIDAGNATSYTATGLAEGQTYYFQITAYDALNNQSECSFDPGEQSITIPGTISSASPAVNSISGGGGGGGGGGTAIAPIDGKISAVESKNASESDIASTSNIASPADLIGLTITPEIESGKAETPAPVALAEIKMAEEAGTVFSNDQFVALSPVNINLYSKVMSSAPGANNEQEKIQVAYFIQTGTPSTKILGAGERAGAIGSYVSAFARLPKTESHWEDVVKISNGHWTNERSRKAENSAVSMFGKVYKRAPNRSAVKYDDNAIMVITYGLRPAKRNIGSEAAAIKSFKNIFNRQPNQANDWDIVRAIAYSGAKR
jgi:hypothetical protein